MAAVQCNALLLPEAVRVRLANGDTEMADRHASELEEIASRFDSRAWRAMAGQARGHVLLARGEPQAALEALERAREAYLFVDQAYEAARCHAARAKAFRALGEEAAASAALEEAKATFTRLGASGQEP